VKSCVIKMPIKGERLGDAQRFHVGKLSQSTQLTDWSANLANQLNAALVMFPSLQHSKKRTGL
jgi:hypothetical protein